MARFQVEKENENIQVKKNQINFRESKPISFLIKSNSRNYFAVPFNAVKVSHGLKIQWEGRGSMKFFQKIFGEGKSFSGIIAFL
jgi:hypothetical protein